MAHGGARATWGWKCRSRKMAILQKQLIAKASLVGKAGHHRNADARVHGVQPPAHPCESTGCGQRDFGRHGLHHALGESAMGKYPEEAVAMLARIAAYTEAHRPPTRLNDLKAIAKQHQPTTVAEAIASV